MESKSLSSLFPKRVYNTDSIKLAFYQGAISAIECINDFMIHNESSYSDAVKSVCEEIANYHGQMVDKLKDF